MIRKFSALFIAVITMASSGFCQLKYPDTKKVTQTDDYFGTKVSDPYRWLEDDNSAATKARLTEFGTSCVTSMLPA